MVPSSTELRKNSGCDIATNKSRPQTDLHMKKQGGRGRASRSSFLRKKQKKIDKATTNVRPSLRPLIFGY